MRHLVQATHCLVALVSSLIVSPAFEANAQDLPAEAQALIEQIAFQQTTPDLFGIISGIQSEQVTLDTGPLTDDSCECKSIVESETDDNDPGSETADTPSSPNLAVVSDESEAQQSTCSCKMIRASVSFELNFTVVYQSTEVDTVDWSNLTTQYDLPKLSSITPKYTGEKKSIIQSKGSRSWSGCLKAWEEAKDGFMKKCEQELNQSIEALKVSGAKKTVTVEVEATRKDNGRKEQVKLRFHHLFDMDGALTIGNLTIVPLNCVRK